jgi:HNH endonuclease/AP2 domain
VKTERMIEKEALLTHARLTEVLAYNPNTGIFLWKVSPMGRIKIGQSAGSINTNGHRQITLDRQHFVAHRLAWFYIYAEWPDDEIDHEDLNKDNNAIDNLREATHSENCRNRKASPLTNTSGYKGVTWHCNKWHAQIKHNTKVFYLGSFDEPTEAHAAYVEASKKFHGEFGRTA